MSFSGLDSKGHEVAFNSFNIYRVLYELFVDFLGDRSQRGDGMTPELHEFKNEIGRLLTYACKSGVAQGRTEMLNEFHVSHKTLEESFEIRQREDRRDFEARRQQFYDRWTPIIEE